MPVISKFKLGGFIRQISVTSGTIFSIGNYIKLSLSYSSNIYCREMQPADLFAYLKAVIQAVHNDGVWPYV